MTKDTGGPAYPSNFVDNRELGGFKDFLGETLLDKRAGEAMPEIQRRQPDAHQVAILAYEQAEEMVREKRRREE